MRPVPARTVRHAAVILTLVAVFGSTAGCGGGAANQAPAVVPRSAHETSAQAPVAPAPEARAPVGGTLATGWKYRFDMISPANQNFGVTTREVYLYFRPDTTSVGFRLENRLGVPIRILWEECTFLDVYGRSFRAVHRGGTYDTRDQPQEPTYVRAGETYSDFIIPVDLVNSPDAASGQGVRPLLPTDLSAQSMVGRVFGPNLVLALENDVRQTFEVRFKVVSVYSDR